MASDAGWLEVEQTLTAMELPPVPPTSDPQRLLGYVVTILPRYTEMEMLSTHLRLYVATLEQEMEQVRGHVRVLSREVEAEREKKQFLERYAAQIVKERNELLHTKGAKHTKRAGATTAAGGASSHFAWHACCKKNATHSLDMTPSISTFRGEKLQDAQHQIKNLQDELRNQEMLRHEMDFLLKKTQREHDSKVAADRKHIQQLERQLLQRSVLSSNLERKLYEVESALAKHDQAKEKEMEVLRIDLDSSIDRATRLADENTALSARVRDLVAECDQLSKRLSATTEAKNALAERVDQLSELQETAEAETESLRSEIELLQSTEIRDVRGEYGARIQKLQRESVAREQALHVEIDELRRELKRNETQLSREAAQRSSQSQAAIADTTAVSAPATSELNDGSLELPHAPDVARHKSSSSGSASLEHEYSVGTSLSRSQLSESSSSSLSSKPASSRSGVMRRLFEGSPSHFDEAASASSGSITHDLRDVGGELQDASDSRSVDAASSASDASFFNWESFIDSPSECDTPDPKRTKRMSLPYEERESAVDAAASTDADELYEATRQLERLGVSAPSVSAASVSVTLERSVVNSCERVSQSVTALHSTAVVDQEFDYSDEEKDEEKQKEDGSGDLANELREMLHGLAQRRVEEERKAELVEQALHEFQRTAQGKSALNR